MVSFANGFHKNNYHRVSKTYVNSKRTNVESARIKITQEYSCHRMALNLNRSIPKFEIKFDKRPPEIQAPSGPRMKVLGVHVKVKFIVIYCQVWC